MHPITKLRKARKLTQKQLVDRVNQLQYLRPSGRLVHITQPHLSAITGGNAKKEMSVPVAQAIAAALGVSVNEVLTPCPRAARRSKTRAA